MTEAAADRLFLCHKFNKPPRGGSLYCNAPYIIFTIKHGLSTQVEISFFIVRKKNDCRPVGRLIKAAEMLGFTWGLFGVYFDEISRKKLK